MRIITNSDGVNNRMKQLLLAQAQPGTEIKIASAFFTSFETLEKMAANQTEIKMVIRLNSGTSPAALKKAIALQNVSIRVFTDTSFHPKFYIFGNRVAYLGSSNLTNSGLIFNQEVNIEIDGEEPVFSELEDAFVEYWNTAHLLEMKDVESFATIIKNLKPSPDPSYQIKSIIGDFKFNNTGLEKDKLSDFIEGFKREYQIFLKKHKELENIYTNTNLRRYPAVPLRFEIDRFIWWIREIYANDQAVRVAPKRTNDELEEFIRPLIQEFHSSKNNFLQLSPEPRYKVLNTVFGSTKSINTMPILEIVDALQFVYAFHESFRRFVSDWKKVESFFIVPNSEIKIRKTLNYLLHGIDSYQERIYRCSKDEKYRLKHFGLNSCTELFGLVNNEDVPIRNSRTVNSMKWLGFGDF